MTVGQAAPPFDVFSLSEDVAKRFGWSNDDLNKVMQQLVPAAFSGFQHFGPTVTGLSQIPSGLNVQSFGNPFASYAKMLNLSDQTALTPFFGPEPVQQAIAAQISGLTGLQSDAIQEMMPVAATLAFGQVMKPFVHGEARNLLDAYLRGFARGRPKPQPTAIDYLQGYTDAVNAFWGSILETSTPSAAREPEPEDEDAFQDVEDEPDDAPSELDTMVSDWMNVGRDLQSNQFKAFDTFFKNASDEMKK